MKTRVVCSMKTAKRKQDRIVAKVEDANTFGALAREYIQKRLAETGRAPATIDKNTHMLTKKAVALTVRRAKPAMPSGKRNQG